MSRGRRLLPDVCGYPVSRIESVDVCSKEDVFCLPSLALYVFVQNVWDLATLKKYFSVNIQICASVTLYLV